MSGAWHRTEDAAATAMTGAAHHRLPRERSAIAGGEADRQSGGRGPRGKPALAAERRQ